MKNMLRSFNLHNCTDGNEKIRPNKFSLAIDAYWCSVGVRITTGHYASHARALNFERWRGREMKSIKILYPMNTSFLFVYRVLPPQCPSNFNTSLYLHTTSALQIYKVEQRCCFNENILVP